jgi:hypothetical protein
VKVPTGAVHASVNIQAEVVDCDPPVFVAPPKSLPVATANPARIFSQHNQRC